MAIGTPSNSRQRRRSLKALLQLPALFPRTVSFTPNSHGQPVAGISLPEDILHEILQELPASDILNLCLCSSHLRALLAPELYRTMHLRSSRACESGLNLLARHPELCGHIRKLALRPNYYLAWPNRDSAVDEVWVAKMVRIIAPGLKKLKTFDWDGTEMPSNTLWRTLRESCPELTELYTNVGFESLNPRSELFNFDDLTLFSLSVRHGLPDSSVFPLREELPPALWDMLLTRCPNLTELTLCSFSAGQRIFQIDRIVEGDWPALTSLTLGTFGYNADFSLASQPPEMPRFLSRHPRLSALRLSWNFRRWMSPDEDAAFQLELPQTLEEFSGIAQQLPCLGWESITTIDLMCEPLYSTRFIALCDALKAMPLLANLEIWVHVEPNMAAYAAFLRDLCAATPKLEDLHFMCTTPFGKKPLSILARALRALPYLRAFALTKGHRYADETMRASAVRVFRAVAGPASQTRLEQVSVRWARAACRNHLKQEGTYARVAPSYSGAEIDAWERGLRAVGGAFERKYRFALTSEV
ncbi:F-box domain-containing protein [Mycena indigotica]|uniref:F-box domain-containing protein n=1 Tax=Mycena indigotica TaxID=2126181 RepID=A0A8H6TC35_9AGAR|nr:F-box domain-containing protein [Mycena indigotica]KAF7316040.1 F-box domain-containing protein [Mycena indigotica]